MSYDLFLYSKKGKTGIARADFVAYFSGRPNYTLNGTQAWYQNEDTGVYWSFAHAEANPPDPGAADGIPSPNHALFNMNYFRPHCFALEAEPEVRAFVDHFRLSISDPQNNGIEGDVYSTAGFMRGWNEGNE